MPKNEAMLCSPLLRAAISVRSLERSLQFYEHLFDFKEQYSRSEGTKDFIATLTGRPPGTYLKAEIRKQPGPNFGMIGLFELDPAPPPMLIDRKSVQLGEVGLFFYHRRLSWVLDELPKYGGELICGPIELEIPGARFMQAMISDPDGVRIGVLDRDPRLAYKTKGLGRTM